MTGEAELVVVTSGPVTECGAVPIVADPAGRIAQGYGMRTPIDRGPPVGYTVVDALGTYLAVLARVAEPATSAAARR